MQAVIQIESLISSWVTH